MRLRRFYVLAGFEAREPRVSLCCRDVEAGRLELGPSGERIPLEFFPAFLAVEVFLDGLLDEPIGRTLTHIGQAAQANLGRSIQLEPGDWTGWHARLSMPFPGAYHLGHQVSTGYSVYRHRVRSAFPRVSEIASHLSASEDQVCLALATLRTKTPIATGRTLNVTLAAHEFVQSEAVEGEAYWETVDRLLGELALRRAFATPMATNGI
jgi:hypothetical protein